MIRNNVELTFVNEIHRYPTSSQSNFFFRTNYGQNDVLCNGLILYNTLPSDLKCLLSLNLFKVKLKEFIMSM